jgi:hypothetical protein
MTERATIPPIEAPEAEEQEWPDEAPASASRRGHSAKIEEAEQALCRAGHLRPLLVPGLPNTPLLERIRSRCTEDPDTGCWLCGLSVNSSGYSNTIRAAACFGGNGEMIQSTRLAYEALRGPIPEGLQADHLCRNKGCLNPYHLEAVTPSVNRQRSRIGEPHPLTAWWFPSPAIAVPAFEGVE